MSKFQVMSRKQCEDFCNLSREDNNFVIISISTPNYLPYANFTNKTLKDVLYLHFDDVDEKDNLKHNMITDRDAELIYNFAYYYFNEKDIKTIIVHCDAGVSRSAGIAAGLMKVMEDDDWPIFNNPRYCPNMTCYRKILECHYDVLNKHQREEIEKKNQHNIKIWKEHNNI